MAIEANGVRISFFQRRALKERGRALSGTPLDNEGAQYIPNLTVTNIYLDVSFGICNESGVLKI